MSSARRALLLFTALAGGLALQSAALAAPSEAALAARAKAVHARVLPIDPHADIPYDAKTGVPDLALAGPGQADLTKLQAGGLGAVVLAVFAPSGPRTPDKIAEAKAESDAKLKAIHDLADRHPKAVTLALSAAEVERARAQHKTAVIAGFLNAYAFGDSLEPIDAYYRQGVRVFGLTHAGNNAFADSSRPGAANPAEEWGGLSPLGAQAVAELNRLGAVIDVSQLTSKGFAQTLALSKAPVLATHSGLKALADVPRNLSDAELDALKANGGVINIVAFSNYLPHAEGQRATVVGLVDAIDYAVKRIGVEHVGIASDFNHGGGVEGFDSEADAPKVTAELLRRGYTEPQIRALWGGNFLRVFRAAETVGRRLSAQALIDGPPSLP